MKAKLIGKVERTGFNPTNLDIHIEWDPEYLKELERLKVSINARDYHLTNEEMGWNVEGHEKDEWDGFNRIRECTGRRKFIDTAPIDEVVLKLQTAFNRFLEEVEKARKEAEARTETRGFEFVYE